jgi:hypothetical protein
MGSAVWAPLGVACSSPTPPSPFAAGAAGGAGGAGGGVTDGGGGSDPDPTLGGPCTVDEQCDDGFDCTFDACDMDILRCRFLPDDSQCQNDIYCDGLEVCDNKIGCILGEPITCSDGSPCSIDTCDEVNQGCLSEPRDVDGDGDPDDHCGGGDCDDLDPTVSSEEDEICANGRDDDCDDTVDEASCQAPSHDTCLDPLSLTAAGTYALTTAAAALDYAASCGVMSMAGARDVVAAVEIAAGPLVDVQLTAKSEDTDVALALMGQCAQPASEIACSPGFDHPAGGRVAKVRGRGVGDLASAVALPVYLQTDNSADVTLRYEILPASTKPANETCGTAAPIAAGVPTVASVVDAAVDLASLCEPKTGELVYSFTLATPQDIDIYAASTDGDGLAVVSLRTSACALPGDEITCATAASGSGSAHLFRHSLPAGDYFVAVGASAPTDVVVTVELSAATPAPADEDCGSAPAIAPNVTADVLLAPHQDDIQIGCVPGGADAAFVLDVPVASDVLLLGRYSLGDTAAVALALPGCSDDTDLLLCATGGTLQPEHGRLRNLPAGTYRVVAESQQNQPMQVTALVRPAVPPTIVPFADNCAEAITIPATGGFFQGTTQNAQPHFDAGCDLGGQPPGGANDQILRLELPAQKRVVLDMTGSAYATILDVREGSACPGMEMPFACASGFQPERSFLDLTLAAGTYFVQVDGYGGEAGPWFLDIHVVDP